MSDVAPPKGQIILDRLKKRLEGYRNHHDEAKPRFEQTVNGVNEEQKKETLILRQRFVDSKTKKSQKKGDKKGSQDSTSGGTKSHKRGADDTSSDHNNTADNGCYEAPKKLPNSSPAFSGSGFSPNKAPSRSKAKFQHHPPESGGRAPKNGLAPPSSQHPHPPHQTLGNNPQPQQRQPPTSEPNSAMHPAPHHHQLHHFQHHHLDSSFKQEVGSCSSSGYVDLDQCAAALEKDGPDLINSDFETLNDLISEISDFSSADFMKDFDFGDEDVSADKSESSLGGGISSSNSTNLSCGHTGLTPITPATNSSMMHYSHPGVKLESGSGHMVGMMAGGHSQQQQCAGPSPSPATTASPLASQLANTNGSTPPYLFSASADPSGSPSASSAPKGGRIQPSLAGSSLPIDSPAAQTLKQMAEQHQHKQQMGGGAGTPNVNSFSKNASPARSPFNEYGGGGGNNNNDYMGASSNGRDFPSHPPGAVNVKQEVYSPTNQPTFSPGYMDVNQVNHGVKSQGQQQVQRGPAQSQQQQQMSHGGRMGQAQQQQVLSPVPKSFNPGMEPQSLIPGQSFITRPPNNAVINSVNANPNNPSSYTPFPGGGTSGPGSMPNPNQQQQMAGRGSPSGPMVIDSKVRLAQQQAQAQYYYQQQQQQNPNLNASMVVPSSQFNPNGSQQGQTINFTQQHLRIGGPSVSSGNVGNMAPRMGVSGMPQPNMNPIPGPGGSRPPQQQQSPSNSQQQQQMMMRQQQQQQQHMAQEQQQQQIGGMGQPLMMNRFPGPNGAQRPPMQQMMPQSPQMINQQQPQSRPIMQSQQQQMYNNSGGSQSGMGVGPSPMSNMHMRQMSPYNNGNHNHLMDSNGPLQQQHPPMGSGQGQGRGEWMSQQQPQYPSMGRQGPPRPNVQMSYHSGMPMQMQQQQSPSGGMMPNYPQQQQGMMPPQQQMGYNHNHNPQMQQQQLSGFNQKQQGHPQQPPPNYPTNSSYGVPMKSNGGMGQQQQQMFTQGIKLPQQQMPLTNDINIDQMLNNIADDPSAFSAGDTADLFHSLDSNYSSILDNL